jgi:hypothetical protein
VPGARRLNLGVLRLDRAWRPARRASPTRHRAHPGAASGVD